MGSLIAVFAYAVATIFGFMAVISWVKAVYHQWAKNGTTRGVVKHTFQGMGAGVVVLAALWIAMKLQGV